MWRMRIVRRNQRGRSASHNPNAGILNLSIEVLNSGLDVSRDQGARHRIGNIELHRECADDG